jgi:hypothetical protein
MGGHAIISTKQAQIHLDFGEQADQSFGKSGQSVEV